MNLSSMRSSNYITVLDNVEMTLNTSHDELLFLGALIINMDYL